MILFRTTRPGDHDWFNLKGVLSFPRLSTEFDAVESHIKLFCNQVFVKFGMMRDDKFYDRLKEQSLFRVAGTQEWTTLAENLDQSLHFSRVDADVTENLIERDASGDLVTGEDGKSRDERIRSLFAEQLANEKVEIRVESFKDDTVPAMILNSEQGRRMREMARFLGQGAAEEGGRTLLVNAASPVIRNLLAFQQQGRSAEVDQLVAQVFDRALLSCQAFDRERMERFLERSNRLLSRIDPGHTES